MQIPMSMTATLAPAGYIVDVVDALDGKRDLPPTFDERQIASGVVDHGQIDNPAQCQRHM